MLDQMMKYYKVIGKIHNVIQTESTLLGAIQKGISVISTICEYDYAIVWYKDPESEVLHPYYWVGPLDFTSSSYKENDGVVGRVYSSQKSERFLYYKKGDDAQTDKVFDKVLLTSMVCVPFSSKTEELGCVQFVNVKEKFTEEIADLFEILTDMIALAIDDNDKIVKKWQFDKIIISAKDIAKTYVNGEIETKVLKGVNLDIYEGEFIAILGESGCGKSTFLNIIAGLDNADGGSFKFYDKEMIHASEEELTLYRRENIGFIFQNYNLMPNLTAIQNLQLIGELVDGPMDAKEALTMVGLQDKMGNYPSQMSGGQQQRISIARALVKKPKLIFADEPTAALDYATSIEVLSVLEQVIHTGATIVMVTHNEEITKMADRVVRMRNGRLFDIQINKCPVKAKELVW